MIKINGPNYPQGSGDDFIFGNFYDGDGSGKGIKSWPFSYYFGNGWGDGCYFGDEKGNGESYSSELLKKEFQK